MRDWRTVAAAGMLAGASCSPLALSVRDLDRAAESANRALSRLEQAYGDELRSAGIVEPEDAARAARAAVSLRYSGAFEAHRAFVLAWQAARSAVGLASRLEVVGAETDFSMSEAIRAAQAALDAGAAFERAAEPAGDELPALTLDGGR